MSKNEELMEVNEGVNTPVDYDECDVKQGKIASIKQEHPKLMKALKIGGIGLLAALFGAGCYKMGKKKAGNQEENPYDIDLDELDQNEQ